MKENCCPLSLLASKPTWLAAILVPLVALAAIGTGGLFAKTGRGPAAPSGVMVAETRQLANQGDDVSSVKEKVAAKDSAEFLNDWQNTVRFPASPRR